MHAMSVNLPAKSLTSQAHAARLSRAGWIVVLGAVVPLTLWSCFAPLSMAVVAPAFVKVDLNRRPVQHLEGGIIREVLVRDGQHVKVGDPILVLGDVGVDADRNRLAYRVHVEHAGIARLEAEQTRARTLAFPQETMAAAARDERVQEALIKEKSLFDARRDSLTSEIALLNAQRQRISQETADCHTMRAQEQCAGADQAISACLAHRLGCHNPWAD